MSGSLIKLQRELIIKKLKETARNDLPYLVLDQNSKRLVYNVASEDEILNANVTNVLQLEERRNPDTDSDAIYLLTPLPYVFSLLEHDLDRRKYRRATVIWTSRPPGGMLEVLMSSESRRSLLTLQGSLDAEYFPHESQAVTFQEPWSFPLLYRPDCSDRIVSYLHQITQKIVSLCVSLEERPIIKYFDPPRQYHARGLCKLLAELVDRALPKYTPAAQGMNMSQPSQRPRALLIITDRTMDLMSPLIHELTYQAMAMDLLPMNEHGGKILYRHLIGEGQQDQEEQEIEISEKDKIWVENRHVYLPDLLEKLPADFKNFLTDHKEFANAQKDGPTINTIKNMVAGLPEFQEGKDAFSLHIDIATKCLDAFQSRLMELVSIEQSLAVGLDENGEVPRNVADQVVKLLDPDPKVAKSESSGQNAAQTKPRQPPLDEERLRLLIMYILYRRVILSRDIDKLLRHATPLGRSTVYDRQAINTLPLLGVNFEKQLGQKLEPSQPLFERQNSSRSGDEIPLNRFEPAIKQLLERIFEGGSDLGFIKTIGRDENEGMSVSSQQTSLRTNALPTWATKNRAGAAKPKNQRVIVFMAGGATYAESRACYEISQQRKKDVYLASTHMITPEMFIQHLRELACNPRDLPLPPKYEVPAWLANDRPQGLPSAPNGSGPRPPVSGMQEMSLNAHSHSSQPSRGSSPAQTAVAPSAPQYPAQDDGKVKKEKKEKKHGFGGMFKKH